MRAAVVLVVLTLLTTVAIAAKGGRWGDPCDPSIIEKAAKSADARIAGVEAKHGEKISIMQQTIAEWKQRIADNDPECAPERLNCAALLAREKKALDKVQQEMQRQVAELKEAKESEAKQLRHRCLAFGNPQGSQAPPSSFIDVKCAEGECRCGPGKTLVKKASSNPEPNGCSVPSFLTFNSVFYQQYLSRWNANACHNHDHCYATCGETQAHCDAEFKKELKTDCSTIVRSLKDVPATLCPWLCDNEKEAQEFFSLAPYGSPRDNVCKPHLDRTDCKANMLSANDLDRYIREDCNRIASLFSIGVQMFGGSAFVDSQRSHCDCVEVERDREL